MKDQAAAASMADESLSHSFPDSPVGSPTTIPNPSPLSCAQTPLMLAKSIKATTKAQRILCFIIEGIVPLPHRQPRRQRTPPQKRHDEAQVCEQRPRSEREPASIQRLSCFSLVSGNALPSKAGFEASGRAGSGGHWCDPALLFAQRRTGVGWPPECRHNAPAMWRR